MVPTAAPAAAASAVAPPGAALAASAGRAGGSLATIRFASGSARLAESEAGALRDAAEIARARNLRVRVLGYPSADAKAPATERRKIADFNLAMDRAEVVARELVRLGVSPAAISVEGRADASSALGGGRAEILLEN